MNKIIVNDCEFPLKAHKNSAKIRIFDFSSTKSKTTLPGKDENQSLMLIYIYKKVHTKTQPINTCPLMAKNRKCSVKQGVLKVFANFTRTHLCCSVFLNKVGGMITAWKVSKYRVFSGPYFPAFGLNTERYGVTIVEFEQVNVNVDVINIVLVFSLLTLNMFHMFF